MSLDVEMNEDCGENEDSEERELEKAYQNVHVNVSKKQWAQLNIPSIIFSQKNQNRIQSNVLHAVSKRILV